MRRRRLRRPRSFPGACVTIPLFGRRAVLACRAAALFIFGLSSLSVAVAVAVTVGVFLAASTFSRAAQHVVRWVCRTASTAGPEVWWREEGGYRKQSPRISSCRRCPWLRVSWASSNPAMGPRDGSKVWRGDAAFCCELFFLNVGLSPCLGRANRHGGWSPTGSPPSESTFMPENLSIITIACLEQRL